MNQEQPFTLAINSRDAEEVRVAIAQGKELQDIRYSCTDRASQVGSIHVGRVKQIEKGLDAAFVDFGGGRSGFLHAGNVHPGYAAADANAFVVATTPTAGAAALVKDASAESDVEDDEEGDSADSNPVGIKAPPKRMAITELLKQGQTVLVQVLRDPNRGKGATVTTFLSLAGRLLVSMPSLTRVGVSRRIQDQDERKRLIEALGDAPGGVIVRTAAEALPKRELQKDLRHLKKRWAALEEGLKVADKPGLLLAEDTPAVRAVRELFNNQIGRVVVDDLDTVKQVQAFLAEWAPHSELEVEHYKRPRPLFESLDIERDYQTLFRARVPIGSGASIVIHETEALCAIDVNSGRLGRSSLEETARDTNMLAAREIARQIHLRDLGGIIVVDFIDMTKVAHRREVEGGFRRMLREKRSRMRAGHLGSFGLMPLTRRRRGTGLPRASEAMCRGCGGSGSIGHHSAGAMRVLRRLRGETEGDWALRAQPGVIAEFKAHYAKTVRDLPIQLTYLEDGQVPAGEPVLERQ